MNRRIAYVTYDQLPAGTDDDARTIPLLAARGVTAIPTIWNDPGVDWSSYDLVVIRSPWDYFIYPDAFRAWLDQLEAARVRVMNPIPILRWNMDKGYLRELADAGVSLAPTRWARRGERADLAAILREEGWAEAVIKPVVSGGAFHTERVTPTTIALAQARLDALLHERDMMIQRYMDEIGTAGEWSLLFFNGRFSHAVIKRPASGDFRVQSQHGGSSAVATAPAEIRQTAESILAQVDSPLLYARVDGLVHEGHFMLIELEILEPSLFLEPAPGARERFVEAVLELL